jgi:hypothetical protein
MTHDQAARRASSPPPSRPIPAAERKPKNIILFVADGLRAAAVSPERAPTFAKVRDTGVNFSNSHSLCPTITTANAAVIATGHFIGDTGDFGNTHTPAFPVAAAAAPSRRSSRTTRAHRAEPASRRQLRRERIADAGARARRAISPPRSARSGRSASTT